MLKLLTVKRVLFFSLSSVVVWCFCAAAISQAAGEWPVYGGNASGQLYSSLDQITPANVRHLKQVWVFHTGDYSKGTAKILPTGFSANPLFVNHTLYVSTPFYNVIALNPETGVVKWRYNPHANLDVDTQPDLKSRGVAYWQAASPVVNAPCQKRIFIGTAAGRLIALDANSGKVCKGFGHNGSINLNDFNNHGKQFILSILQPPTIYKNLVITGWSGKDFFFSNAPDGIIRAFNAITGKQVWSWDPIPPDMRGKTGTANTWAQMSVDKKHGIIYAPTSSASPSYYGGRRKKLMPYTNAVVALDAQTGKPIWHFQIVHHDLWDYDTNAEPVLVNIKVKGKTVPALIQVSKMGFIFVLNRLTGKPIFPIVERAVPQSHVPHEKSWPTQPFPSWPKPIARLTFTFSKPWWIANLLSRGWCSKIYHSWRNDGIFTPPSLKGTINFPGNMGGTEWGGAAVDPNQHILVTTSTNLAYLLKLIPRKAYEKIKIASKPIERSHYPQIGTPYGLMARPFLTKEMLPCTPPTWSVITAINLDTKKVLWKKPIGSMIKAKHFHTPKRWGAPTIGGPVITKSGLVFIAGTLDNRIRAYNLKTGKRLWRASIPAPGLATPATFSYKGKQYLVIVAGGNPFIRGSGGDAIVAFALPDKYIHHK